jgi:hypothetical protein
MTIATPRPAAKASDSFNRSCERMGNEMQQRHAKHQAGNKTHCRLDSRMSQMHRQQHPSVMIAR